jgi:hypothetical protein
MMRSNEVTITVANPPQPTNYAASGAASAAVTIESPFLAGQSPRTRRLTYADQIAKYPGCEGLKFADALVGKPLVWRTRGMQK